ncbi:MAG: radical SAM protein [Clostridia bacterium]|nr:radical SAM protein [Clostridia bacterium]
MNILDLTACRLCPRECGADRTKGEKGVCGASDKIICARASLHLWEEPCLSGDKGSGTVFFSGCNMGCVFCQNGQISHGGKGIKISPQRLCEIFFELRDKGAHNINLVTAGHFLPQVIRAVEKAKVKNIGIPFVYNSSSYEKREAIAKCKGLIDIFLPDFKYMENENAKKYSNAFDYPEIAKEAIEEMVTQQPECIFDDGGLIERGVIVRHMMLPSHLRESKKIIKYLHDTYGDKIFISIMSQYTPVGNLEKFPELMNKVSKKDYDKLVDFAIELGVENAFIQEGEAAQESFIPEFSGEGIEG